MFYKTGFFVYNSFSMTDFLRAGKLWLIDRDFWQVLALFTMSAFVLVFLFFGQNIWIYGAVLFVCFISILFAPEAGLSVALVATMWFERHFTLQPLVWGDFSYKIYPLDFILLFTAFSVGARLISGELKFVWRKFDLPILIFGAVCVFGLIWSVVIGSDMDLAFSTFKNYFVYAVVYFLAVIILRREGDWKNLARWLAFGGVGIFFFLFYGLIAGQGLWSEFTPLSTSGARLIAGTHVFYLTLFGFGLVAALLWPKGWDILKKKIERDWLGLALALVGLALVVSLVRHLWLALIFIFIAWLIFSTADIQRRLWAIAGRGLLATAAAFVIFLWGHALLVGGLPASFDKVVHVLSERASVVNVISLRDESFRWRMAAWRAGLNLWTNSPVWGIGLGRLVVGADETYVFEIPMRDLHNNYLGVLIQLGLLGAAAVIGWFVYLLAASRRLWRAVRGRDEFSTVLAFTCVSAVLLFMIVFSVSVYWDINLFIIWWWLALAGLRWLEAKEKI